MLKKTHDLADRDQTPSIANLSNHPTLLFLCCGHAAFRFRPQGRTVQAVEPLHVDTVVHRACMHAANQYRCLPSIPLTLSGHRVFHVLRLVSPNCTQAHSLAKPVSFIKVSNVLVPTSVQQQYRPTSVTIPERHDIYRQGNFYQDILNSTKH
jgi:hypothetical protein